MRFLERLESFFFGRPILCVKLGKRANWEWLEGKLGMVTSDTFSRSGIVWILCPEETDALLSGNKPHVKGGISRVALSVEADQMKHYIPDVYDARRLVRWRIPCLSC
jgi:hypothetical protein